MAPQRRRGKLGGRGNGGGSVAMAQTPGALMCHRPVLRAPAVVGRLLAVPGLEGGAELDPVAVRREGAVTGGDMLTVRAQAPRLLAVRRAQQRPETDRTFFITRI